MKRMVILALGILVILAALASWAATQYRRENIASFAECSATGYPILESYPPQCVTPRGQRFVQDIGNELEKTNLIRIDTPRPQQTVVGPIIVSGQARGTWFFEASFPVTLLTTDGTVLVQTHAQASSEWMTEDFVPFTATIPVPENFTGAATLVLERDNPSGLAENSDALYVPITITLSPAPY